MKNVLSFFRRRGSAPVARERLQLLLAHERATLGGRSDLVSILREEIMAVIAKHVTVERDKIQVRMDRGGSVSTLEVDIEIRTPNGAELALSAKRPSRPSARGLPARACRPICREGLAAGGPWSRVRPLALRPARAAGLSTRSSAG